MLFVNVSQVFRIFNEIIRMKCIQLKVNNSWHWAISNHHVLSLFRAFSLRRKTSNKTQQDLTLFRWIVSVNFHPQRAFTCLLVKNHLGASMRSSLRHLFSLFSLMFSLCVCLSCIYRIQFIYVFFHHIINSPRRKQFIDFIVSEQRK